MNRAFTVFYANPDTNEEFQQTFYFDEEIVKELLDQMHSYSDGMIEKDSPLFYLFTGVKYISKLQGFEKTPNFTVIDPEEMITAQKHRPEA